MEIVSWIKPGWHVDVPDPQVAIEMGWLLSAIESTIVAANASLNQAHDYTRTLNQIIRRRQFMTDLEVQARSSKIVAIEADLVRSKYPPIPNIDLDELDSRAMKGDDFESKVSKVQLEKRVHRETVSAAASQMIMIDDAAKGTPPRAFLSANISSAAQHYILLVDRFSKLLCQLNTLHPMSSYAASVSDFNAYFPDIVALRDNVAHLDERLLGYAKQKGSRKRYKITPTDSNGVNRTALVIGDIDKDGYHMTLKNGKKGTISLSMDGVRLLLKLLEAAYRDIPIVPSPSCVPFP